MLTFLRDQHFRFLFTFHLVQPETLVFAAFIAGPILLFLCLRSVGALTL